MIKMKREKSSFKNYTHVLSLDSIKQIAGGARDFQYSLRCNGIQYIAEYKNGYQASILNYGFGGEHNLYEVAVLVDGEICYDTPVTEDVLGYVSEEEVVKICSRIRNLKTIE